MMTAITLNKIIPLRSITQRGDSAIEARVKVKLNWRTETANIANKRENIVYYVGQLCVNVYATKDTYREDHIIIKKMKMFLKLTRFSVHDVRIGQGDGGGCGGLAKVSQGEQNQLPERNKR